MSTLDTAYSNLIDLLEKRDHLTVPGNTRVGAAVLTNRQIYAYGVNSWKSHPLQAKYAKHPESIYLHAETDALRRAAWMFPPETIQTMYMLVVRILADGSIGLSMPCGGCFNALEAFGISKVYFTWNGTDELGVEDVG